MHEGRRVGVSAITAALILSAGTVAGAAGAARSAPSPSATVSFFHGIPASSGAGLVDVFVGRTLAADDMKPGSVASIRLTPGTYNVTVYADGTSPGSGTALLSEPRFRVAGSPNQTLAIGLGTTGRPAMTVFANDTTTAGNGKGRLTVRHVAQAPRVDVRANGRILFSGLRNSAGLSASLLAGTYRTDAVLPGGRRAVGGPIPVTIKNQPGTQDMGTNTIVYIWGRMDQGPLQLTVQEVRLDLR